MAESKQAVVRALRACRVGADFLALGKRHLGVGLRLEHICAQLAARKVAVLLHSAGAPQELLILRRCGCR